MFEQSFAFTVQDSPAVIERIRADLDRVVERVRHADARLRSLVLTGGFARGEGAVLRGEPQNDYDLVAIRGAGRPRVPYARVRASLEAELGLHIDLAPVSAWRLPWVSPSIFWYETALRGRTLWGEEMLSRIPVREASRLAPTEGLRLLANRAAGLLLVTQEEPQGAAHAYRIQAAKGLLAAMDAWLLARGEFPPSQRERWERHAALRRGDDASGRGDEGGWLEWAYGFKVDPGGAAVRDPVAAWCAARRAILHAIPIALRHAGLRSLAQYARQDGWVDRAFYALRAGEVPGARRFAMHPTGRVRVATLRLLADTVDARVTRRSADRHLAGLVQLDGAPLPRLEALRAATLQ